VTDQLRGDLQVAGVRGLFAAGQVNGTSGYEEAAGQGLVAGANAALFVRGEGPFVLDRATAYLGVMVDDLCRVNPSEPYRMFTSRAEYRLLLRSDNADRRLTPIGRSLGLVDEGAAASVGRKEQRILAARKLLDLERHEGRTLCEWLRRPEVVVDQLCSWNPLLAGMGLGPDELSELEAEVKYEGYVARQAMEVERLRRMEGTKLPPSLDYRSVPGLSSEARARLEQRRPITLGEASRIPGVRQADLQLLLVVLRRAPAGASGA
jgi:tRNA uridine 5-carboxymethylaminomethyl modification enzyme